MFEGFARQWTAVLPAHHLGRKKPLGITVASEKVVLFRNRDGEAAALLDRCPHRGVMLSLGKRTPDGCLACPFHGWEFDSTGACQHVPLNPAPEEKRRHLGAQALPIRERGGLLWLYTAPGAEPGTEPQVPESLERKDVARWYGVFSWSTHWTRVMENMLDTPHTPFVHATTIGAGLKKRMTRNSTLDMRTEPTDQGFAILASLDGAPATRMLEWVRPNVMTLSIPIPGKLMKIHSLCVPKDEGHTELIVAATRNFGLWNPFFRLFDEFNRVIANQDQAVVESHFPVEVPDPSEERSVASDRPTLAFRRWYLRELKDSRVEVGRQGPATEM